MGRTAVKRAREPVKNAGPRRRKRAKVEPSTSMAMIRSTTAVTRRYPMAIPDGRKVTLKYVSYFLGASTSSVNVLVLRANSIFDPDLTGGGHQPMGRDQWATFYNRYLVTDARVRATFQAAGSSQTVGAAVGINIAETLSPGTTWPTEAEQPQSVWTTMQPDWDSPNAMKTLYGSFNAKKFFNVNTVKDNHDLGAIIGTNPARPAYFHIWRQTLNESTASQVYITYEIEYDVMFLDPKTLATS